MFTLLFVVFSSPPSFKAVLQRKVCIVSPGKIRKSPKKYLWSNAEDLATVQFIVLVVLTSTVIFSSVNKPLLFKVIVETF